MSDDRTLTPRELLEREKARLLEQAEAVDRDLAELDRLAAKYGLTVTASAPSSPPAGDVGRPAPQVKETAREPVLVREVQT